MIFELYQAVNIYIHTDISYTKTNIYHKDPSTTNISPVKVGLFTPQKERKSSSNHPFSGVNSLAGESFQGPGYWDASPPIPSLGSIDGAAVEDSALVDAMAIHGPC